MTRCRIGAAERESVFQFSYAAFVEAVESCAESAPVVSAHNEPQVSPQEWDCGCVTACYVTDRDARWGEHPFEMRVACACLTPECATLPLIREHEEASRGE